MVTAGEANSFVVDRPLTIAGQGNPSVSAALQKPAIKVLSDGVTISGFAIRGVAKDSTAKFSYYMQNPAAAANAGLDDISLCGQDCAEEEQKCQQGKTDGDPAAVFQGLFLLFSA
jgi:nitrous oxidase accessory protein NosD